MRLLSTNSQTKRKCTVTQLAPHALEIDQVVQRTEWLELHTPNIKVTWCFVLQ